MTISSVSLLVSHGSRDPRPQIAIERLAKIVNQRLESGSFSTQFPNKTGFGEDDQQFYPVTVVSKPFLPTIYTASLELASMPLHQRIQEIAQDVKSTGIRRLNILPLFLLPGVHVKQDIPAEVALAQESLGTEFQLELNPYLGCSPGLTILVAKQLDCLRRKFFSHEPPEEARIILAHGSRRQGGNQPIETLASQFNATATYWSIAPSLEEKVKEILQEGKQKIAVLPYFLFPGGITDAIAQQVQALQYKFPQIQLRLGQPLGSFSQFTDLIIKALEQK